MLALGCVREDYIPPAGGGQLRWARPAPQVFLQGQSSGSVGGIYLLLGDRPNAPERVFRLEASAPKGRFSLDGATGLQTMEQLGRSMARHRLDQVMPVFFAEPATPFVPVPEGAPDATVS